MWNFHLIFVLTSDDNDDVVHPEDNLQGVISLLPTVQCTETLSRFLSLFPSPSPQPHPLGSFVFCLSVLLFWDKFSYFLRPSSHSVPRAESAAILPSKKNSILSVNYVVCSERPHTKGKLQDRATQSVMESTERTREDVLEGRKRKTGGQDLSKWEMSWSIF